ncbi:MAG: FAD-dependent oxidoreductase [Candidatus Omnitrophica bacterium]|nr:FAD-dependent oxidoreductase [Candidatus Omnitrophota bacterium]
MAQELTARVKEVIQRTYNVKSVRLEIGARIDFKAGQFLAVTLLGNPALKKYLSISSSPTETCYLEFTKKLTNSDFSKAVAQLKSGDTVKIEYPFGKFTLDDPGADIAFLSGGIGITPIRSIAKYVVDKNLGTDMVLVYANRSVKEIVFKEDFDAMQKAYPKLKVAHVLCEPAVGFKCIPGLINARVIRDEVNNYPQRKFYLCGPPQMVEAMKKILIAELSLAAENIVSENFQGY